LNLVKSNTDLQKQMLAVCKNSDIKYIWISIKQPNIKKSPFPVCLA
jgi:hypothetical protein